MNNIKQKSFDISTLKFSSTVFPTGQDLKLWENLSEEQRLAIIERDEKKAFDSGIALKESKDEIIARVRAEKSDAARWMAMV